MSSKPHTAGQTISKLRQVGMEIASGATVALTGLDLAGCDVIAVSIETADPQITFVSDRVLMPVQREVETLLPSGHPVVDG
ncbi:MAG TPA: hypothetical protein VM366_03590 [Anaerolineae bacterium]|nr:hypothetical protein [Anaerolineae bacterium]